MTTNAVARDMLAYKPPPQAGHSTLAEYLDSWGISREVGDLLLHDPNALLFSTIFNYQIKYKTALEAPYVLASRLGHLDVRRLAKMRQENLFKYIRRNGDAPSLHRFPSRIAGKLIAASKLLLRKYKGNAANIWPNGESAAEVIRRLDEFEGIGQKLSRLTTRVLVEYMGVTLADWQELDIAVDRHVARVFLRTGLVNRPPGTYPVSELVDEVTAKARALYPQFPGALDEPAVEVGMEWCNAEEAYCDWPEEPCPLRKTCPRRIDRNVE
jgi:endonuclease III